MIFHGRFERIKSLRGIEPRQRHIMGPPFPYIQRKMVPNPSIRPFSPGNLLSVGSFSDLGVALIGLDFCEKT